MMRRSAATRNRRWPVSLLFVFYREDSSCRRTLRCVHQWPHVASDCPLTQDDQDVSCSVKVVRSVVAAMLSAAGWQAGGTQFAGCSMQDHIHIRIVGSGTSVPRGAGLIRRCRVAALVPMPGE